MGCASTSAQTDNVVAPSANYIEPGVPKEVINDLPEVKSLEQIEEKGVHPPVV